MRKYLFGLIAAALATTSQAAMIDAAPTLAPLAQPAQFVVGPPANVFFFQGRAYCWYDGGWNGPGWYWCGYAERVGLGFGGGDGFRGWTRAAWFARGGRGFGHHGGRFPGGGPRHGHHGGGRPHGGGPRHGHHGGGHHGGGHRHGGGHHGGHHGGRHRR